MQLKREVECESVMRSEMGQTMAAVKCMSERVWNDGDDKNMSDGAKGSKEQVTSDGRWEWRWRGRG